jgi:hypothetical protein
MVTVLLVTVVTVLLVTVVTVLLVTVVTVLLVAMVPVRTRGHRGLGFSGAGWRRAGRVFNVLYDEE